MAKTRSQLEAECQSTIKLLVTELEMMRDMDAPPGAAEVYFDEARRRVIRKVWNLFKECLAYSGDENA